MEDEAEQHGDKKASQCQGTQHHRKKGLRQRHQQEDDECTSTNHEYERSRYSVAGQARAAREVTLDDAISHRAIQVFSRILPSATASREPSANWTIARVASSPGFSAIVPSRPATWTARLFQTSVPCRGGVSGIAF